MKKTIPAKAGIQIQVNWILHQVRNGCIDWRFLIWNLEKSSANPF